MGRILGGLDEVREAVAEAEAGAVGGEGGDEGAVRENGFAFACVKYW